jgi:hypothetical protein
MIKLAFSTAVIVAGFLWAPTFSLAQNRFVEIPTVAGEATFIPFGNGPDQYLFQSIRYQQIYDSSYFIGRVPVPFIILGMEIRSARTSIGFDATLPEVEMRLSTSSARADQLNSVFAENVGGDETIVYNRGPLRLQSASGAIYPFAWIPFHRPFFFDAAQGSLLLEIRHYRPITDEDIIARVHPLDAEDEIEDAVSRIYAYDVKAETATFEDTVGFWTSLYVTIVPRLHARAAAGPLELIWNGSPSFHLQRAATLSSPVWVDVPGTQGASSFTETNLTGSAFYRLIFTP